MKIKIRAISVNLMRYILGWLTAAAKTLLSKFALKGKSFQPFPNEAPH